MHGVDIIVYRVLMIVKRPSLEIVQLSGRRCHHANISFRNSLIAPVVQFHYQHLPRQGMERALRWLHQHQPGIEEVLLELPGGGHLRVNEELVHVSEDYEISVDEYQFVVLIELPYPELAVVPFVVGVLS